MMRSPETEAFHLKLERRVALCANSEIQEALWDFLVSFALKSVLYLMAKRSMMTRRDRSLPPKDTHQITSTENGVRSHRFKLTGESGSIFVGAPTLRPILSQIRDLN